VVSSPAEVFGEAVESVRVLKPRVSCVTTESCDGVGDVGGRAQQEVHKCARDVLEAFGVEGKRLVEDELFYLSEAAYLSLFVRSQDAGLSVRATFAQSTGRVLTVRGN